MKRLISLLTILAMFSVSSAKERQAPKGFSEFSVSELEKLESDNEFILILQSNIHLCSSCSSVAGSQDLILDSLKKLQSELKEEVALVYSGLFDYDATRSYLGSKNYGELTTQYNKSWVAAVLYDTENKSVEPIAGLCPKAKSSSKEKKEAVTRGVAQVQELIKAANASDLEEIRETIGVKSINGPSLEITPVKVEENTLHYLFKGENHKIDLTKLTDDSVTAVRSYLK